MAKKIINWKTKGMNRDISVSAFNAEFAFENYNLRLATNEGNTMMSWVNERGTKKMTVHIDTTPGETDKKTYEDTLYGTPVGTAVLNHQLVIFTSDDNNYDYIYVLKASDGDYDFEGRMLYGNKSLNLQANWPLETLVSYESENIQKVYWTDNHNQPRVINIAPYMDKKAQSYDIYSFDFVPRLSLEEEVSVTQIFGSGEFPAGVIQYAFTYYNKYMQESNIFYTTPLYYICYTDRAGAPDAKIANSFQIKIENVDTSFDYIRIYSILRTSKDATPFCKRVADVDCHNLASLYFIDDGLKGDTIDPTELLYLGGEDVTVKTMEQKDGTLFLGNLTTSRLSLGTLRENILSENEVSKSSPLATKNIVSLSDTRKFKVVGKDSTNNFQYYNTLDSSGGNWRGAACFKSNEYYRLGVQFQHYSGKWSEPCWIGDAKCTATPAHGSNDTESVSVPVFTYTIKTEIMEQAYGLGFRKVRPLFVMPGSQDKTIVCQGIGAPTMYTHEQRNMGTIYGTPSWLFRTPIPSSLDGAADSVDWNIAAKTTTTGKGGGGVINPKGGLSFRSQYCYDIGKATSKDDVIMSPFMSSTEIPGRIGGDHNYYIDLNLVTLNSPDVEFDDAIDSTDLSDYKLCRVGFTTFEHTYGDIDIQTSTPTISSDAEGFIHKSIDTEGYGALISGLYYSDYLVDDGGDDTVEYASYSWERSPAMFPVYMWQKNGSLNNDVSRDNRSAVLLKKKISNLRMGGVTKYYGTQNNDLKVSDIKLFNSDEPTMVKINGHIYTGNVDTMVVPTSASPFYFANFSQYGYADSASFKDRLKNILYLTWDADNNKTNHLERYLWSTSKSMWELTGYPISDKHIGDKVYALAGWREGISIKYKSTPHLVAELGKDKTLYDDIESLPGAAPIYEVYKEYNKDTTFGGTADEVLQAATWIPCGPPMYIDGDKDVTVTYKWGDCYFQRWECLKTYAYTKEDKNQVVEIASFMIETRTNIDGRYDRNRASTSNLNASPTTFNLINPVYSQMNNFFSYKILPEEYYDNNSFPNTVTWTKTKESGADVDLWTNITMASTLEMDGDKGEVNKLTRLNNQLISLQDSGVSQILYNEQTQISSTEGVPIEIANSEKIQGKRYYSDTIGCSNKWSVVQTPSGIYFMDSNNKAIFLFNGQLNNISVTGGFNAWMKQNIPSSDKEWTPKDFDSFVAYYDKLNQEVYFISKDTTLAYSEKFNFFTSFYDYEGTPYFNCLDDIEVWTTTSGELWRHQAGEYCTFFGTEKPYSMTLVANQESQVDKIFTNLEFRACIEGEGTYNEDTDKFTPLLPFEKLEAWDEYQHGILTLTNQHARAIHGDTSGDLIRKFRMWRCDIPRDNAPVDDSTESKMGIKRFKAKPLDRMRNPWVYLKLSKDSNTAHKTEIHDIVATYYA
jgi:hypothetical protein